MNNSQIKLPDAERDVLACLNQLGEATVKELQEAMHSVRAMEAASVLTLLNRLEGKKLVSKRKADKGKAFVFQPTKESARACQGLMKDLFHRVFGGDTMSFMASFLAAQKPSTEEIEQLQQLLDGLRQESVDEEGSQP
ncbi:MAG: BlaI/MecI/CopY family transcriptional regulator [Planctomycetota bacterium]|nr:BlaI/MecI/CopY family transcriptional regulator [Planctomycetota bacterium]